MARKTKKTVKKATKPSKKTTKTTNKKPVASATGKNVKEEYPHFRIYYKSKHPAMIVGEINEENKEKYRYRKVMHGEKDGRHLNEKIEPNPNPKDPKPMYVSKRIKKDEKNLFSSKLPWKIKKK